MIIQRLNYSSVICSLLVLDYFIGNGFVDGFQKLISKISNVFSSAKVDEELSKTVPEPPISFQVFLLEIFVLIVTMMFLRNYKSRGKDRFDELLQESKDKLKETNDILDRWRQERAPIRYSYLHNRPQVGSDQDRFEVPVLQMAIVDKRSPSITKERGDASNAVNVTDSELLSVTSLIDEDLESIPEAISIPESEKVLSDALRTEYRNRFFNSDKRVV